MEYTLRVRLDPLVRKFCLPLVIDADEQHACVHGRLRTVPDMCSSRWGGACVADHHPWKPWVTLQAWNLAGEGVHQHASKHSWKSGMCVKNINPGHPGWLQAWNLTGDEFTKHAGERSWMSEMYGYSYGAAVAGVWHRKMDYTNSLLPGYAALCAQPPTSLCHWPA